MPYPVPYAPRVDDYKHKNVADREAAAKAEAVADDDAVS